MKRNIFYCLLFIGVILALVKCTRSQSLPLHIDKYDLEVLKRTEAQLQGLQMKYAAEAGPIIKEHDEVVALYCAKAGLTIGQNGTCQMDLQAGVVTKRATPTPSAVQGK